MFPVNCGRCGACHYRKCCFLATTWTVQSHNMLTDAPRTVSDDMSVLHHCRQHCKQNFAGHQNTAENATGVITIVLNGYIRPTECPGAGELVVLECLGWPNQVLGSILAIYARFAGSSFRGGPRCGAIRCRLAI